MSSPSAQKDSNHQMKQWNFAPGDEYEYYNDDAPDSIATSSPPLSALSEEEGEDVPSSNVLQSLVQYGSRAHRLWGIAGTPHCWINTNHIPHNVERSRLDALLNEKQPWVYKKYKKF